MNETLHRELAEPYALTGEHRRFFRTNGYIKLKQVLSAPVLEHYGREITGKVIELNTLDVPMAQRTTYQKAFLQVGNLWTHSDTVRAFALSPRLGRIAAELMGTRGVRMYHDQALYKEAGGGFTPWHADQYYWPLATDRCCTVWVPLQATPQPMGPLAFSAGSHRVDLGRDLGISDESEAAIQRAFEQAGLPYVEEPFDLGEVSYHYGWTFHRAGPNRTDRPREVMTVIYMDAGMRLAAPGNRNQQADWDAWCPGARVGEVIASPLNPVIYSAD